MNSETRYFQPSDQLRFRFKVEILPEMDYVQPVAPLITMFCFSPFAFWEVNDDASFPSALIQLVKLTLVRTQLSFLLYVDRDVIS